MMEPSDPTLLPTLLTRHQLTLEQLRARGRSTPEVAARRAAVVRDLQGIGCAVPLVCALTGLTATGVRRLLRPPPPSSWSRDQYRAAVLGRVTASAGFEAPEEVPLELPYVVVRGRRRDGGWGYVVAAPRAVLTAAAASLEAFRVLVGDSPVKVLPGRDLGLES